MLVFICLCCMLYHPPLCYLNMLLIAYVVICAYYHSPMQLFAYVIIWISSTYTFVLILTVIKFQKYARFNFPYLEKLP